MTAPEAPLRKAAVWLTALALLTTAGTTHAAEGVVEINQTRAIAGGITPGDGPGFPVTIDAPGSYALTSNLTLTDPNTTAVEITADDVSIDLRGFTLQGPVSCTGVGTTLECLPTGTGYGIRDANSQWRTTVTNGSVRGFARTGIDLQNDCRIHAVKVFQNGDHGLFVGSCTVTDSEAVANGADGMQFGSCVAARNRVRGNREAGIYVSIGGTLLGNTVSRNGIDGIRALAPVTVNDNLILNNDGDGVDVSSGSVVKGNAIRGNDGYGLRSGSTSGYAQNVISTFASSVGTVTGGGVNLGGNLCDGAPCPP